MADKRRRGVRIGTESPASHSSIASNITTANSTTNPPAQRPRQPVNGGRIPRSIDNQYILTTIADARLGYALPSNNGYVRAPQGRVLPAWANPGFRVKLDVYFVEYGLWFEDSGYRIRNLGWVQNLVQQLQDLLAVCYVESGATAAGFAGPGLAEVLLGAAALFGLWSLSRSLNSCVNHILSQDGSRMQAELATIESWVCPA
ncbi:unnamed protein product [Malus baccata var. baccata]